MTLLQNVLLVYRGYQRTLTMNDLLKNGPFILTREQKFLGQLTFVRTLHGTLDKAFNRLTSF